MSKQDNKSIVEKLIEEVWRQGRIDALPLFWTDDCINHADPASDNRGLDALRRYHEGFAPWFQNFQDVEIEVHQQIADDDRVASQIVLRAVHIALQRKVAFETMRIDRIAGDKIAEHWSVADMAGLTQQLA